MSIRSGIEASHQQHHPQHHRKRSAIDSSLGYVNETAASTLENRQEGQPAVPSTLSLTGPVVVDTSALLGQVGRLRVLAWKADGELPSIAPKSDTWLDDHDLHAVNWAVMCDGRPVAAARMCVHYNAVDVPDLVSVAGFEASLPMPVAAFTRLVIDPQYRGLGLSSQLDNLRLEAAQSKGCGSAFAVTHLPRRMQQLCQSGFRSLGESVHRTVSSAPSFVFVRDLQSHETALSKSLSCSPACITARGQGGE